ncbi:hypothetical protein F7D84_00715 [Prevotella copri]|nr:hypothetical protein [Segatella copri]
MKKTSIFSLTAALMMTANLYAQSSYKVTVNPNICYQTIADFGSSDCWTADFVGKYFSDAEKEKSAKWLFSQEMDADGNPEGIGLSMWRVNLGAGSAEQGSQSGIEDITRRGYCYLDANGNYDWTKSAGQQYLWSRSFSALLQFSPSTVYQKRQGMRQQGCERKQSRRQSLCRLCQIPHDNNQTLHRQRLQHNPH